MSASSPSKPAFTPGPWEMSVCDDGRLMVHTAGDVICYFDRNLALDDPWELADARAIMALPELYAALAALVDPDVAPLVMSDAWSAKLMDDARAALAKAEGRS